MELEGLKRCREELALHQIKVSSLTTDRHTGVTKYVRQQWPEIKHYFDTWHISKGTPDYQYGSLLFTSWYGKQNYGNDIV